MPKVKENELKNLGDFSILGKYTGYICLLYEVLVVSQVSNLIYMIYGGAAAHVYGCDGRLFAGESATERCAEYAKYQNSTGCKNPVVKGDFVSVASEFNYFCGDAKIVKNSISLQMIGIMFGAIIFGLLSDSIGRRKTLIFGTVGLIVSGLASTFTPNLTLFTISRFFVMFFTGGKHSVSYVYMMESLPTRHRMWIVTVITYSPNYLVFTAIAYLTGEWRLLSRVVALFTFVPLVMLMFTQESPRWLIQKGRIDEARKAMVAMGKWDNLNSPERLQCLDEILDKERDRIKQSANSGRRYYVYHLFSTKAFGCYTTLFAYSLMITSIISYGLVFNMEKLSGSIYLNTVIVGSLRYAINLVCAALDVKFKWVGRRLLHGISMASIAAGLGIVFLIVVFEMDWEAAIRVIALAAAAMCSQIYILNAVTPSELFPTAIRNQEIGFIQTFNRVGNIIAPQIFVLADLWIPLPYLVMGLFALVEVIAFLCLVPETKGKQLPDRMPDELTGDEKGKLLVKIEKNSSESVPLNDVKN